MPPKNKSMKNALKESGISGWGTDCPWSVTTRGCLIRQCLSRVLNPTLRILPSNWLWSNKSERYMKNIPYSLRSASRVDTSFLTSISDLPAIMAFMTWSTSYDGQPTVLPPRGIGLGKSPLEILSARVVGGSPVL